MMTDEERTKKPEQVVFEGDINSISYCGRFVGFRKALR